MPSQKIGFALIQIISRLRQMNGKERITLDNMVDVLGQISKPLHDQFVSKLDVNVEDLTAAEFRAVVASLRDFLLGAFTDQFVQQRINTKNVILMLTDPDQLVRMARIDPKPVPKDFSEQPQLVRAGHPTSSDNQEIGISTDLMGARLTSYYYIAGEKHLGGEGARGELMAHDGDEFVYFIGMPEHPDQACRGNLPIYVEGEQGPYSHVDDPIPFSPGEVFLYDANAPHFWYGTPKSVAFFVSASLSGLHRKPLAFRWKHGEQTPGGSYQLFPNKEGSEERTHYLLGKRLRRWRDLFQLSADAVQKLDDRTAANMIGKIESGSIPNVSMRQIARFAEAMDLTLDELFPWSPFERAAIANPQSVKAILSERSLVPLFVDSEKALPPAPYAIAPFAINVPAARAGKQQLWEGEADIAIFVVAGAIEVVVAPNPLLFAIELGSERQQSSAAGSLPPLLPNQLESLVQRGLLRRDRIPKSHAFQFNASLPHAVFGADEVTQAIVVTTRVDRWLPNAWFNDRRPDERSLLQ